MSGKSCFDVLDKIFVPKHVQKTEDIKGYTIKYGHILENGDIIDEVLVSYFCGASFLVNLEHVTGVDGGEAVLDNGERLALPRSAATFKDDWGKFWLEEGAVCPIG